MSRPKATFPKIRFHVVLSQELAGKLMLRFRSEHNETGLMKGALSEFIEQAAREKLERMKT